MSREFLGAEDYGLSAPAGESDDVDLGTFQTGSLQTGSLQTGSLQTGGSQGVDFRRPPEESPPAATTGQSRAHQTTANATVSDQDVRAISDWAISDWAGGDRRNRPGSDPLRDTEVVDPRPFVPRRPSDDVVGSAGHDPEPGPGLAGHEPDSDDFIEDLTDESGTAPEAAGPARSGGRARRPPLVALLVGMALVTLFAAAVAYEQTGRFIEGRAVDGAQVVGYLSTQGVVLDTSGGNGAAVEGDFLLATSAAMPLTLERLDLGYGVVAVRGGVVLRRDGITKVHLSVPAVCGAPTSVPAADVVSPDGRHYRLAVSGPSQQVSDYASQLFCGTLDSQSGPGADNSSFVPGPDPAAQQATGLAVGEMSAHGRAFSIKIRAGVAAPPTRVTLLPVDRPHDPRSRTAWQLDVQPRAAATVQPGGTLSLVVVLRYSGCAKGDPRPAVHPVQVLAVPVDSPDSPRTRIAGWHEDVVARAAANALAVDCP